VIFPQTPGDVTFFATRECTGCEGGRDDPFALHCSPPGDASDDNAIIKMVMREYVNTWLAMADEECMVEKECVLPKWKVDLKRGERAGTR
jgi:hypothetical protein